MMRVLLLSLPLLISSIPAPAAAQFPFGIGARKQQQQAQQQSDDDCSLSQGSRRGSNVAGNILGGLASRALGGRASAITNYVSVNVFTNALTNAIACQLDKDEQKQAADATEEALEGGVGTKSSWTSATRQGVTGSSVVTAANSRADGGTCMTVNDVVIVDGEETTVSKQMCRAPGGGGYVLST